MRRMLVFQAGADATPTAVINPEVEWLSDEKATAEEGCLSLPRVAVDVERALFARVSGRDVHGEPLALEAAGLEARVLQHEIDHLDGVLILDRTERDQRKGALRALREGDLLRAPRLRGGRRAGASRSSAYRLPGHVRVRGDRAPRPGRARRTARRSSSRRPTDGAEGDASWPRRRRRTRRASSASSCCRPRTSTTPEASERIAAAGPDVGVVCAFGQIIREPLLSQPEMLNVHPSLLPRWRGAAPIERAIMAGDAETGVTIMRLTEGLDSGPIALQEPVAIGLGRRPREPRGASRRPRRRADGPRPRPARAPAS